jgi:hypothetical protein
VSVIKVFVPDTTDAYAFPEGMTVAEIKAVLINQGVITEANGYTVEENADGSETYRFTRIVGGTKG